MNYGEVDLPVPFSEDSAESGGDAPLDLSELDLLTPKADTPDEAEPDLSELDLLTPKVNAPDGAAPDLSELDLVAPKVSAPGESAPDLSELDLDELSEPGEPESAVKGSRKGKAARVKSKSKAVASSENRLLGLPKKLAIGIIVAVVLVAAGTAAYLLRGRGHEGAPKTKTSAATNSNNAAPLKPQPHGKTPVAYAPAMDLDTHEGYLAADKTYRKQNKKTASDSLQSARAKARLCDAYRYGIKGKRLAKAIKLLAGGDADDVEWRKAKGLRYLLRKQLKKARKQLKKARAKAKKDPEVHVFLGWVELEAKHMELAEKSFRRAIKYRGESAAALFGLAQSLTDQQDPTKVAERRKLLSKVISLSPRHVAARVTLLAEKPVKLASEGIKALTDLSTSLGDGAAPNERATLAMGLGVLHRRAGQLDRALVLLGQASGLAPHQVQILRSEGEALLEAGDGDQAAKRIKAALKIAPHSDRLLEGLVRAHIARGQPQAAKDAILDFTERLPKASPPKKVAPKKKIRKKREKKRPKKRRSRRKDKSGEPPKTKSGDGAKKSVERKIAGPRSPYESLARGRTALALGKMTEAKNLFLESTAEAPQFTPGHVAYLALMLQRGRLEGMKSVLDLIKRKYRNTLPSDLQDMEGRLLLARSKPAKAQKVFQTALESDPNNNRILIHLALCLWRHQNQPEEAYLLLQKIYNRAKSLTRVVSLLADYHWSSGEKERSFGRFKAALKVNRSLSLRRQYAEFLLRSPDPVRLARAKKLLEPILKANSLDHAATALFALVDLGQGRNKKAMTRINRAISRSPGNLSYLVIKARISETRGRVNDALSIYEDLLVKHPKQRRIILFRAQLLCRNRITKRCLKAAQAILRLWDAPEGYLLQGLGYLQKRKPGKAMRAFKKAIAKKKNYAEAHFLLGRTSYDDASYRKALTSLIRCMELAEENAPWWPDIHYFLGMSYFKVRNKRMAQKHLKKYLTTKGNPKNVETGEQQRTAKSTLKKL
jgi:tetratricopeptide (TPR) repeat protein